MIAHRIVAILFAWGGLFQGYGGRTRRAEGQSPRVRARTNCSKCGAALPRSGICKKCSSERKKRELPGNK